VPQEERGPQHGSGVCWWADTFGEQGGAAQMAASAKASAVGSPKRPAMSPELGATMVAAIAPPLSSPPPKRPLKTRGSRQTSLNMRVYQRGDPTAAAENCTFPKTPL
jgi:phage tail sheath gpL-like